MILKLTINVKDKLEAYDVVSRLSFKHELVDAEFGKHKELFDKENRPAYFMKDKQKNIAKFKNYESRE